MDATRRGNYESGSDYVLEYGELRFTFNERDFTERVEQAAVKLGFVAGRLVGRGRVPAVASVPRGNLPAFRSPGDPCSGASAVASPDEDAIDHPYERQLHPRPVQVGIPPSRIHLYVYRTYKWIFTVVGSDV